MKQKKKVFKLAYVGGGGTDRVTADKMIITADGRAYRFYNDVRGDDGTWTTESVAYHPVNNTRIINIKEAD